jgi:hypothetical protein
VGTSEARALEIYHGGIRQAVLARMDPDLVRGENAEGKKVETF